MDRYNEAKRTLMALLVMIALMLAGLMSLFVQQDNYRRSQIKAVKKTQKEIMQDVSELNSKVVHIHTAEDEADDEQ